ncbi:hypothetical protein SAMN05428949_3220 [Chitinophaga sp. YR627]|uniref:hypothetical protein n=1 Tax=Chitinophaga sp. YR627 TaxID=1881041 RepID=UPI0008E05808|nr:hypothetical protein [Chitinophaga sp. YR627]SFN70976.1 hypothetical protein SAMN05428949_3220 [Chitinophaga sp. YR627]
MTRLFLILFAAVLLSSCGQSSEQRTATVDTINTLTVKGPGAVIFTPAGDKLRSLKAAIGEKGFPSLEAINKSTLSEDSAYLAAKGVKVISTSATLLKFIKPNGEVFYLSLAHPKYSWEIFLYNGYSDPVKADLTDIESAYLESGIKKP